MNWKLLKKNSMLCKDDDDNKRIERTKKAMARILDETKNQMENVLIAFNRLKDKQVAKCVHGKLSCGEADTFDQFFDDRGALKIDASNADAFVDFVQKHHRLVLGDSKAMSETGKEFVRHFTTFAEIARLKFIDKPSEDEESEVGETETPTQSAREMCHGNDEETKLEEYLARKFQQEKDDDVERWNCIVEKYNRHLGGRLERDKKVIAECLEKTEKLKEEAMEGVEEERAKLDDIVKRALKEEAELRKKWQTAENAEYIIIDRYDTEIGESQTIYDELMEKKIKEEKKFAKLKRKLKHQDEIYQEALKNEDQWEIEDLKKEVSKLRYMMANRTLDTFLTAYIEYWKTKRDTQFNIGH